VTPDRARSFEEAWEEIAQLRLRLRYLQKDVRTLGERLHVLQQEVDANRPLIIVRRPVGGVLPDNDGDVG
jgi:hypothetical protein